jgi:hypothetical protein
MFLKTNRVQNIINPTRIQVDPTNYKEERMFYNYIENLFGAHVFDSSKKTWLFLMHVFKSMCSFFENHGYAACLKMCEDDSCFWGKARAFAV